MSGTTVNGHDLCCAWFEMEQCDCGYDEIWDPFLPDFWDEEEELRT